MVIRSACVSALFFCCCQVIAGPLGIENVSPDEAVYGEEMTQIKAGAEKAMNEALAADSMEWARKDEVNSVAQGDLDSIVKEKVQADAKEVVSGETFVIFVSWSMGEGRIKEILREYNGEKKVVVKFRGIVEGDSMPQALTRIQALSSETKSDVEIQIDPVAFTDSGVSQVPAIVRRDGDKVVGVARGTASVGVFENKKDVYDLGSFGEVVDIAERDLIEVMKERFVKLDPEEIKKKAINRFWLNQVFSELPSAAESRIRKLDPTVVIPEEMRAPDGTLIHAAGTRINPLDIRPFHQRLVIIDPGQDWQMSLARDQIKAYGANQLITIILTRVPKDSGWDELKRVEDQLGQPAYILQADVRVRFDLQFSPSIVTAKGKHFFIQEVARRDME